MKKNRSRSIQKHRNRYSAAKNIMLTAAGLVVLMAAAICPFPMILAIPGTVWRMIIGLLGCFSFALGIYRISGKK